MQQRHSRTIRGLALSAAILVAVTAASTRLFAATMAGGESGIIKERMCRSVGCDGGSRACADATVGLEIKEVGKVQVTYHCYEPGSGSGGPDVI